MQMNVANSQRVVKENEQTRSKEVVLKYDSKSFDGLGRKMDVQGTRIPGDIAGLACR